MKTIKFEPSLVPRVLSGEKTSTWRLFDDKDLRVGDDVSLVDRSTGKEFATARIVSVKEKPMGKIEEADFKGHESYESREKMFETFRGYYGDRVSEDSVMKMIGFELTRSEV